MYKTHSIFINKESKDTKDFYSKKISTTNQLQLNEKDKSRISKSRKSQESNSFNKIAIRSPKGKKDLRECIYNNI
jgi:hypothetical protein